MPRGRALSEDRWRRRHRAMVVLLAAHALVIPAVAVALGTPLVHAVLEGAGLAALAGTATLPQLGRRTRALVATFGLMTASALVVHVSGGVTEAHFHFFIVLGLLGLYEDWSPFALALAYVVVHHGLLGAFDPHAVVADHDPDEAWYWAAVHGTYIGAAAVANALAWHLTSDVREDARIGARRYRAVVEGVSQIIFQTDGEGRWTFLNPAWEQLTGLPVADTLGAPALDFVLPEDRPLALRVLELREGRERVQVRHVSPDGETRWFEVRAQPAAGGDGVFGTIADVTDRQRSEEQLAQRALHDPLTGLPNRVLFRDRLDLALASAVREQDRVAVLFIDLDDFKQVNDEQGHSAGDALLREVADALTDELRAGDTAARLGGDEFAVLVTGDAGAEEAAEVAARIHARFEHGDATVSVGVTSGTATTGADQLLREADAAMYRAKAEGRNGVAVFDDTMRTYASRQLRLEADLFGALDAGELELHFQPVVALAEHEVVGFEAFLRWNHPEHGRLEPREFLPIAEQSGAIVPIGDWVVAAACAWLADWQRDHADGRRLNVGVNVSARQLAHRRFADRVDAALHSTGLDPAQLFLEVGEHALGGGDRRIAATVDDLDELGVQLVLDDFGTGASSLSSLKRFPIDAVKIDGSFVDGLTEDASDQAIVTAIAGMAAALGIRLAAEGVERPEQAERLTALGCDFAQGRFFAGPAPAAVTAAWLDERQRSAAGQTIR